MKPPSSGLISSSFNSFSLMKLIRRVDMIIRGMFDDSILTIKEENYDKPIKLKL